MVRKPLGFADTRQAAEFFGLRLAEIEKKATSGEWPSYLIGGKRVLDLDVIVETLARNAPSPTQSEKGATR